MSYYCVKGLDEDGTPQSTKNKDKLAAAKSVTLFKF